MLGIRKLRGVAIDLWQGDITTFACDAMVNAANSSLTGGGGVDAAIHSAAGPSLLEECSRIGRCETGEAVITGAGELPAEFVIHAVGPRWNGGTSDEPALLVRSYKRCLQLAYEHQLRHIAIPAISTGVYGYPVAAAAEVAMNACRQFLFEFEFPSSLERITHVLYERAAYEIFQSELFKVFPE